MIILYLPVANYNLYEYAKPLSFKQLILFMSI